MEVMAPLAMTAKTRLAAVMVLAEAERDLDTTTMTRLVETESRGALCGRPD